MAGEVTLDEDTVDELEATIDEPEATDCEDIVDERQEKSPHYSMCLGFSNWKKALEKFNKHQNTLSHHQAMDFLVSTSKDVGEMLNTSLANERAGNRKMLHIVFSSIRFLARQGVALRGSFRACENSDVKCEFDSNFMQLLRMRAEDNQDILQWLSKSRDKFVSPDIQNEILSIMSLHIIRGICSEMSGEWYSLMVDETTDLSNIEQMVFCL